MTEFDRDKYLEVCSTDRSLSAAELAKWGIIFVLVLTGVDLLLTMIKVMEGAFVDDNPIAQALISHQHPAVLVLFKVCAAALFASVCLKHRGRRSTQIGVGIVAVVHMVLFFHWLMVF